MTGVGHTHTGIGFSMAVFYATYNYLAPESVPLSLVGLLCFIFGSTAPDWLEIRKKTGGTVITHRGITHWVPLWAGLVYLAIKINETQCFGLSFFAENVFLLELLYVSLFTFSTGAILHLITDFPNPMGVPFLTPKHRFSLKLWKSGKFEPQLIAVSYIIGYSWIGLDSGFIVLDFTVLNL